MNHNPIVSRDEWLIARKQLLAKEKELTRHRDALNAERRRLPMVKIDKDYVFEGPGGRVRLLDLFAGRRQLIVYHFMFDPKWAEGCPNCSFLVDNLGHLAHLHARNTSLVLVSRAPLAKIEPFKVRMGWTVPWYSSFGSDFNYDFHVSFTQDDIAKGEVYYNYDLRKLQSEEMSGRSVFYQDEKGDIFHTYFSYARGGDMFLGTYVFLDVTPKGRNEAGPNHNLTDWVRHHDRYDDGGFIDPTGRYVAPQELDSCHSSGEDHA
jgi:predicted dithiol-disulfide oxidoreductase (DUF899 family)